MASTIQKLLRKSPPTRIFSALHRQSELNPTVSFILQQPHRNEIKSDPHLRHIPNPKPFLGAEIPEDLVPLSRIYPSFPFGFCLNPIPLTGLVPPEAEMVVVVDDDSRKVWADSTKKKRKKKMNKHKYKKLLKRLQR